MTISPCFPSVNPPRRARLVTLMKASEGDRQATGTVRPKRFPTPLSAAVSDIHVDRLSHCLSPAGGVLSISESGEYARCLLAPLRYRSYREWMMVLYSITVQQAAEKPFRHSRTTKADTFGARGEHTRRMPKKAVQQGHSFEADPRFTSHVSRFTAPENDARTLLADFFSILLDRMNRQEVFPCRCMSTCAWTVARKLCSR